MLKLHRQRLRDAFVALSLANLCFLDPWVRLLGMNSWRSFFRHEPPSRLDLICLPLMVLIAAGTFWLLKVLAQRFLSSFGLDFVRVGFLFVLLTPLNAIRLELPSARYTSSIIKWIFDRGGAPGILLGTDTVLVLLVLIFLRWGRGLCRVAVPAMLILAPFALVTFAQAGWLLLTYDSSFAHYRESSARPVSQARHRAGPRVVWLLFDEMDRGAVRRKDPAAIRLPSLDRLRDESLYSSQAYSPTFCTHLTLPSYMLGRAVKKLKPLSPSDAELTFSDGADARWSDQQNIFGQAHQAGLRVGVVGWYLPYCRLLGGDVDYCWWGSIYGYTGRSGQTVQTNLMDHAWTAADTAPFMDLLLERVDTLEQCIQSIDAYQDILSRAEQLAANPSFDLVFVHFPVPHPPGFFRRDVGRFDCSGDYLDNYGLVETALAGVRKAMEASGTWQNSALLVTSDHPYRPWLWGGMPLRPNDSKTPDVNRMYRLVPFIVRLPSSDKTLRYTRRFSTVIVHDLVWALLQGQIANQAQLVAWLDRHVAEVDELAVPISACQ